MQGVPTVWLGWQASSSFPSSPRAWGRGKGCSGGCGASKSPTLSSGAEGPVGLGGQLVATGPQALASALRSGWGWQRGSLRSPPGTPASLDEALCCSAAAPAPLFPGELAKGMPAFILPSSPYPLRLFQTQLRGQQAGRAMGMSGNSLLSSVRTEPVGTPGSRGRWGGFAPTACTHALGVAMGLEGGNTQCPHPCKAIGVSLGEVPSGEPHVVTSPHVLPPSFFAAAGRGPPSTEADDIIPSNCTLITRPPATSFA